VAGAQNRPKSHWQLINEAAIIGNCGIAAAFTPGQHINAPASCIPPYFILRAQIDEYARLFFSKLLKYRHWFGRDLRVIFPRN
jgi:hypothetical protein